MNIVERSQKFPQAIIQAAQQAQKLTGCLSSLTLSQWAQESGYGESCPKGSNNYFGIKAKPGEPYVISPTDEVVGGRKVRVLGKFAKYSTPEEGFIAHGQLLMDPNGPYKTAQPYAKDWQQFIKHISKPIAPHPYAGDENYAAEITALVNQWQLTDFDQVVAN